MKNVTILHSGNLGQTFCIETIEFSLKTEARKLIFVANFPSGDRLEVSKKPDECNKLFLHTTFRFISVT